MAQVINSSEELLDGAQIAFKMVSALKGGQSPFASNDLRCYDLGQIKTKYYTALSDTYSAAPDNRLPAHSGYFPIVYFKYGTTDAIAHQATLSSYVFKDNSFDGTADSYVAIGDTLYSAYGSPGSNTPAPAGYYMRGDNFYWYISGTAGVIASSGTYVPPAPDPRTAVDYYGFDEFYSETDAWWSGYPSFSLMGTIWYGNGTYYTTETGDTPASGGTYLTMVGNAPENSGYLII